MSLSMEVGLLASLIRDDNVAAKWVREDLQQINRALELNNLPPHQEPEALGELTHRGRIASIPYSFVHHLRRAVAYARSGATNYTPVNDDEDAANDVLVDDEYFAVMESHVICHSDCQGYYLPIDFTEIIFSTDDIEIPYGMVGSSYQAQRELADAASLIDIQLNATRQLSNEEAAKLLQEHPESHPCWKERAGWLCLFEACRLSIENKSAIVFM